MTVTRRSARWLALLACAWWGTPAAAAIATAPTAAEQAASVLAMEQGTWDAAITFPAQGPDKPATHARGVQVNELRSGGMWMLNRFSVEGTPYEGTGLWGFDRTTGRFSGVWADNNDAQIRLDDGLWDAAVQTMTWSAELVQPDGKHLRLIMTEEFRETTRIFRSIALTRRGEMPLVEIVFTRRADGAEGHSRQ